MRGAVLPEGPSARCSQDWSANGGTCRPRVGKRISVRATLSDRLQGKKTERGGTGFVRSLVSGALCLLLRLRFAAFLFFNVRAPCNPGQGENGPKIKEGSHSCCRRFDALAHVRGTDDPPSSPIFRAWLIFWDDLAMLGRWWLRWL